MLPKSWIEASRFTITSLWDMFTAPFERFTVRIIGRSSGVSPTAKATANRRDSRTSFRRRARMKKTKSTRAIVTSMIRMPNCRRPRADSASRSRGTSF